MKIKRVLWIGAVAILAILTCAVVLDQYNESWASIDGGGGRSVGTTYAATGVIGQFDPGIGNSGNYQIQGGFLVKFPPADAAVQSWPKYK